MATRLHCFLALILLGPGCASIESITSGHTGCPEGEVQVYHERLAFNGDKSWSARCRGQVYHCIRTAGVNSCKPEPGAAPGAPAPEPEAATAPGTPAPVPSAPTLAGCRYDNQCKGDRICRSGECVDPAPRSAVPVTPPPPGPASRESGGDPAPAAVPVAPPTFEQAMGITIDDAAKHASSMGLKTSLGAVLLSVRPGSPAHARQLRTGDVIVGLTTNQVKRAADVHRLARPLKPGQRVHLIVQRESRIFSFYMQF